MSTLTKRESLSAMIESFRLVSLSKNVDAVVHVVEIDDAVDNAAVIVHVC